MPLKQNSLRILIWQSQRLLEEDRPRLEPPQQQVQQLQLQQPEHLRKQKTLVMQQKRRRRQGRLPRHAQHRTPRIHSRASTRWVHSPTIGILMLRVCPHQPARY